MLINRLRIPEMIQKLFNPLYAIEISEHFDYIH